MALEFVYVHIKLFHGASSSPEPEDKLCKGPLCKPLTQKHCWQEPHFSCLTSAEIWQSCQNVKSTGFIIINVFKNSLYFFFLIQAHDWTLSHPDPFSTHGAQQCSKAQGLNESSCFMLFGDLKQTNKQKFEVVLLMSNSKFSSQSRYIKMVLLKGLMDYFSTGIVLPPPTFSQREGFGGGWSCYELGDEFELWHTLHPIRICWGA